MARRRTAFALARAYRFAPITLASPAQIAAVRADRDAWSVELAWDGHRVLLSRVGDDTRLTSIDFREWSASFPSIVRAARKLPCREVVLEGSVAALDDAMQPSFERLEAFVAGKARPRVVFAVSDVLHLDDEDLRSLPLEDRRQRLAALLEGNDVLVRGGTLDASIDVRTASTFGTLLARPAASVYPPPIWLSMTPLPVRGLSAPPVVTNASKVLYPRDGLKKQDIVDYYDAVAAVMLPHLRDRPVVCQRWPDGIDDFTWYQHRMPPKAPDYVRAVMIEQNRRIVIEDRRGLLWLANQAALTFHGWASRVASLDRPDWLTLDLDPGEATTWAQTIEVALAVRAMLELLELPSVVKTSGQKGIHVLVPLAPEHSVQDVHDAAAGIARVVARTLPGLVTLETQKEKRGGRLLLDHQQSFVGKSLVLPYSLRAVDGAIVSAPIAWSEVTPSLDPRAWNLRTMRGRLDAVGDLARPLLEGTAKLGPVLRRLAVG